MLQDMNHMEASCVVYVKVRKFNQLKQSAICDSIVTSVGIVPLTIHHDLMLSLCFV